MTVLIDCGPRRWAPSGHMASTPIISTVSFDLRAHKVMISHMNQAVLAHLDAIRAAGVLIAAVADVVDL
jgi:hypothetical protein